MSQSQHPTQASPSSADSLLQNPAAQVRVSETRQSQLQTYVEALIPSHLDIPVEVVVEPGIERAFVAPATEEALTSPSDSSLSQQQAETILEKTEAEYLVVITGQETPTANLSVDHQPTVDKEFQHALALHETLHILKTAVTGQHDLLESEVEEQYQSFVDRLINATEDGALEHELRTGDDWSDHAGTRILLARKVTDDLSPDDTPQQKTFTLGDAIFSGVYEYLIYESGELKQLLDPANTDSQFESQDARSAFISLLPSIRTLRDDIFSLRSDSSDSLYHDDKEVSIKRAQRTIDFWEEIKPLVTKSSDPDSSPSQAGASGSSSGNGSPQSTNGNQHDSSQSGSKPAENNDQSPNPSDNSTHDTDPQAEGDDIDPDAVSLEPQATQEPSQSPTEQPEILDEPNPEDISEDETENTNPSEAQNSDNQISGGSDHSGTSEDGGDPSETTENTEESAPQNDDSPVDGNASPDSSGEGTGDSNDGNEEHKTTVTTETDSKSAPVASHAQSEDDDGQSDQRPSGTDLHPTLGDFAGQQTDTSDDDAASEDNTNSEDAEAAEDAGDSPSSSDDSGSQSVPDSGQDLNSENESADELADIPSDSDEISHEDLATDPDRLDESIDNRTPDRDALEDELDALSSQLEDEQKSQTDEFRGEESDSGVSSLDDLTVLPASETAETGPSPTWDDIEDKAHTVTNTLAKELQLDQQTSTRNGLSAGSYNTKTGYRLSYGDPRTFNRTVSGDEKRYCIVLVLDRSGSMSSHWGGSKIDVATEAVARFVVAAEELGIDVAVVDFCDDTPRLAKPISVEAEYASDTLLDTETGGGTPLADALSLSRTVVQANRSQNQRALIINITDDEAESVGEVKTEISNSRVPVCSLTIATDRSPGNLSFKAERLASEYEVTDTVYEESELDSALDRFASLLGRF